MPLDAERALDLNQPSDRAHLATELATIERTADRFRRYVATMPRGDSVHALATSASRPDHAYEYCVAVLKERLAARHHVDPSTLGR